MIGKLAIYFLVGGAVTALISWLGSLGRPVVAAFVSNLPMLTVVSFIFIYLATGPEVTRSYDKGLIAFFPAWLLYVFFVMLAVSRLGIFRALGGGLALYILSALLSRLLLLKTNWWS